MSFFTGIDSSKHKATRKSRRDSTTDRTQVNYHQSLGLFRVENGEAFQGRNLTQNLVSGHECP